MLLSLRQHVSEHQWLGNQIQRQRQNITVNAETNVGPMQLETLRRMIGAIRKVDFLGNVAKVLGQESMIGAGIQNDIRYNLVQHYLKRSIMQIKSRYTTDISLP